MNINGMRSNNKEKINYFIEACMRYNIDCFLLIEMNTKWTISTTDKIRTKLHLLGRELYLSFADSTDHTATPSDWL